MPTWKSYLNQIIKPLGCGAAFCAALVFQHPVAAQEKITLDVQAFRGGYGIDFFENAAREYEKINPNVTIKISGNPQIHETLNPQFAAGTPPDLTWPGWQMNVWPLIHEGQLYPFDEYLDKPAYNSTKTWRETFIPSLLKKGQYKGKTYILPYNFDTFGWWYDKTLFDKHGWQPPKDWDELLVLSEKIKKEGIAPVTFTGRYPFYPLLGIYYPWAISIGGIDVYKAGQNMEPGAWKHPAFLEAARRVVQFKKLGYFQPGCVGMNHVESQMELLVGRAAMIPCGSWLHAEMLKLTPAEFQMTYMRPPVIPTDKTDPTIIYASADGKGWMIPTKGKHHDAAAEFFRYMSSPQKAKEFIEAKGTMMSVMTEEKLNAPPHLEGPLKAIAEAKNTWATEHWDWYTSFQTETETAFVDLYNEIITPEQFVDRLEAAAEKIRNDKTITIMKVE